MYVCFLLFPGISTMYYYIQDVKDPRAINLLIAKGYMDLEETLMQWRQAAHLVDIFDPVDVKEKNWLDNMTLEEKIVLGIDARYN
jgi:hypothetical protein